MAASELTANACSFVNLIGQLCLGGPAGYSSLTVKTIDKIQDILQLFCKLVNSGVGYSTQSKSYSLFTTGRPKNCSLPYIKG